MSNWPENVPWGWFCFKKVYTKRNLFLYFVKIFREIGRQVIKTVAPDGLI